MAQRGGAVQSHFRISSVPIHSDVIPKGSAELILSLEPMEVLRYLPWLKEDGWIVVNESPVENIPDYPELGLLHSSLDELPRLFRLDGARLAKDNGAARALNMVMLGAGAMFTGLPLESLEKAIASHFATKGDKVVDTNLKIFNSALELARAERGG
jgi:indolepyruvate ferredoxin oxidoreductase beta subunit